MPDRDAAGRFVPGNEAGVAGGRARAAKLPREERQRIARKGIQSFADKHFGGDLDAALREISRRGVEARKRKAAGVRAEDVSPEESTAEG